MKRAQFIRTLKRAAELAQVDFREVEWTNHTALYVGGQVTTLGRHREIDEITVRKINKYFEETLGKGWWIK